MKLYIKDKIRDTLPLIEVTIYSGDDATAYASTMGYAYPVICINGYTLKSQEISNFRLYMGYDNPIPNATFTIFDADNRIKNTYKIDEKSEVVIWLGMVFSPAPPVKFKMNITKITNVNRNIYVTTELALPEEPITIYHDTIDKMLQQLADTSGLGIKFQDNTYDGYVYPDNFPKTSVKDFLLKFFGDLKLNWCIDNEYNVCSRDVKLAIAEHKDETVDILLINGIKLSKEQVVQFNNAVQTETQFKIWHWGADKIPAINKVYDVQDTKLSKSSALDISKQQIPEQSSKRNADPYDTVELKFDCDVNGMLQVGYTRPIVILTQEDQSAKHDCKEIEDGSAYAGKGERIIVDYTGIYLIQSIWYEFKPSKFAIDAHIEAKFDKPRDIELDKASTEIKREYFEKENTYDEQATYVVEGEDEEEYSPPVNIDNTEKISKYLTYGQANKHGSKMPGDVLANLRAIGYAVYDKIYEHFGGKIFVSSAYRSPTVNSNTPGASKTSQHMTGQALDIKLTSGNNKKLFCYIRDNLLFDQLIWEFGDKRNPRWVHVSYKTSGNRKLITQAFGTPGSSHVSYLNNTDFVKNVTA